MSFLFFPSYQYPNSRDTFFKLLFTYFCRFFRSFFFFLFLNITLGDKASPFWLPDLSLYLLSPKDHLSFTICFAWLAWFCLCQKGLYVPYFSFILWDRDAHEIATEKKLVVIWVLHGYYYYYCVRGQRSNKVIPSTTIWSPIYAPLY